MGERKAAVFCVGNRLMLDEGVGPAVHDTVLRDYEVPSNVRLFDVGCMSLDMLPYVDSYDVIITVDAVDGTSMPRVRCTASRPTPWPGIPGRWPRCTI